MSEIDIYSLGIQTTATPERKFSLPAEIAENLRILIRGVALHAIESDPEELQVLQHRMSVIADTLTAQSSADDVLVGIGQTLRLLEEYNRRAATVFKGQVDELRGMLSTMTATVMFITSSSDTSVKQLGAIETKLQRASTLEDTRQVKTYLADCLTLVRSETLRLQTEARSKINNLQSDVERLSSRLRAVSTDDSEDAVTGLRGRAAAEEAIRSRIAAGKEFLAALFVVDRIASINSRFGRLVGDDILVTGAQALAQKLSGTTLCRWSGPAFVAIFDPSVNFAQAELRAQQAAAIHLEKSLEAENNREVLILVTVSSHLQRISGKVSADVVFRTMDGFVASRNPPGTPASSA